MGPLRAELALSTVATVTRIIARYETLCRGVAGNFYILRQEIGLGFVATYVVQEVHHLGGSGGMHPQEIFVFLFLDLFDSIWWHFRLSNRHPHELC